MLRRAVSFLTILVAISIFVTGPVNGQNTTPLQVERAVSPQQGQLQKDEFVVELTLTGNSASCPQLPPLLKSDIVLVMDRSGSMAGERLAALKRASKLFLTKVNFANDQVALVEFAGAAFTSQNFTTNAAALAA